jgi:transcriptional regulator with XRE-family HTH domain
MDNIPSRPAMSVSTRIHYIPEWAEKRGLTQAKIVVAIDADKGNVSRWFRGKLPGPEYLERIAQLFDTDVKALFHHPNDDWLIRFFENKTEAQKEKAIAMLELMFSEQ